MRGGFALRNAGSGLVQQQDFRPQRKREGDLQQPLLPVGDLRHLAVGGGLQAKGAQQRLGLFEDFRHRPERSVQAAGTALALQDGECEMLPRRHLRKQARDLEGSHQAALHAVHRIHAVDRLAGDADDPGIRLQMAGDEIDERGLAGAVRPDQRHAVAWRHRQRDGLGHR